MAIKYLSHNHGVLMMTASTTNNPSKPRRRWRWIPDRFELFEVAVLIGVFYVLAVGDIMWGWGSGGFVWDIFWFGVCALTYALALLGAQILLRLRFGGSQEDPHSVIGFVILPIVGGLTLIAISPGGEPVFMGFLILTWYCVAQVIPIDYNSLHRRPDSGLGQDPLKREDKRERGTW